MKKETTPAMKQGAGDCVYRMAHKSEDLNTLTSESRQEPFVTAWTFPEHVPILYFFSLKNSLSEKEEAWEWFIWEYWPITVLPFFLRPI